YQRSAKSNVSISEAVPHGKFIILENTHRSKDVYIGAWKLKRKLDGRRYAVYIFPRDYVQQPANTGKNWARNQGLHNPPDHLVFDGVANVVASLLRSNSRVAPAVRTALSTHTTQPT
ncbi:Muscle cell intermediate filament protein OV71, partial [Aphelenchoides avenae]